MQANHTNAKSKIRVGYYKSLSDNKGCSIPIEDFIKVIKDGKYADQIAKIRDARRKGDPDLCSNLKEHLPAATPCAEFEPIRKAEFVKTYNQLVVLDFDAIPEKQIESTKSSVCKEPFVLSTFISPSARGLKIICKIDSGLDNHREAFTSLKNYFKKQHKIIADKGNDLPRMCIVSHDPDIYYNSNPQAFNVFLQDFNHAVTSMSNTEQFIKGNRNDFLFILACNCNRIGIPLDLAIKYARTKYSVKSDFENELIGSMTSAYTSNRAEHGTKKDLNRKEPIIETDIEKKLMTKYQFRYNEITCRAEYASIGSTRFKVIDERTSNSMLRFLINAEFKIRRDYLRALIMSDFSISFNPFNDYFDALPKWDGKDHILKLANTVKSTNQEYWQKYFRMFLVGSCAGVLQCKANHLVLVLLGNQGIGKTTWLNRLIPKQLNRYCTVENISPDNKDTQLLLAEKWFINIDEQLAKLSKRATETLKSLVTKDRIQIRRPYAPFPEDFDRRASFMGSVNDYEYLYDMTGSRRFISIEATEIDYEHKADMNQVYAQAQELLLNGFRYYPDKADIAEIEEVNQPHVILREEEEYLHEYYVPCSPTDEHAEFYKTTELRDMLASSKGISPSFLSVKVLGAALGKSFTRLKKDDRYKYAVRPKGKVELHQAIKDGRGLHS